MYRGVVHPLVLRAAGDERSRRALKPQRGVLPVLRDARALRNRRARVALRGSGIRDDAAAHVLRALGRVRAGGAVGAPSHIAGERGARRVLHGAPAGARADREATGGGGMSGERLSALDASFLAVETPTAHMHVGWVAVFTAAADGRLPSFPEIRDHIARRLGVRAALSPEARVGAARPVRARVDRRPGVLGRPPRVLGAGSAPTTSSTK